MITESRSRPATNETASKGSSENHSHPTAYLRPGAVAARLTAVDDILESAWAGLASGTLDLHRLRATNEHLFSIYMLGFDAGIAAQEARVRQSQADADRYYLRAFSDRAAAIEARLDAALETVPDDVEPHGVDYFEHVLSGVLIGGAA